MHIEMLLREREKKIKTIHCAAEKKYERIYNNNSIHKQTGNTKV